MTPKIKICSLVNEMGIGGTARQVVTMEKYLNKEFFEHFVISVGSPGDVRAKFFGSGIFFAKNSDEAVEEIIKRGTDVVYVQRHGKNEHLHDMVAEALPKEILLAELNTFSVLDKGEFGQRTDLHLFVSATNILKYLRQNKLNFDFEKMKVVYGLFDSQNFIQNSPTGDELNQFKAKYDLNGYFVIGRLARAVHSKWDDQTILFWKRLCRANPKIKFIIYGVPGDKRDLLLKSGLRDNLLIFEETSSDKELALFYSVIDAFVHLSPIGECNCGAITEAMFFGKPVVVTSTPFPRVAYRTHTRDNGQLEQIKNGENGYVVNSAVAMAAAVDLLSKRPEICVSMGKKNHNEVATKYDAKIGIRNLEKIFVASLFKKGKTLPVEILEYEKKLSYFPGKKFIEEWFLEYDRRISEVYGKDQSNLSDRLYVGYLAFLRKVKSLLKMIK